MFDGWAGSSYVSYLWHKDLLFICICIDNFLLLLCLLYEEIYYLQHYTIIANHLDIWKSKLWANYSGTDYTYDISSKSVLWPSLDLCGYIQENNGIISIEMNNSYATCVDDNNTWQMSTQILHTLSSTNVTYFLSRKR